VLYQHSQNKNNITYNGWVYEKVCFDEHLNFYWGSYSKMATIRKRDFDFYDNLIHLNEISKGNECVFILTFLQKF
jgi:hypothetical protein